MSPIARPPSQTHAPTLVKVDQFAEPNVRLARRPDMQTHTSELAITRDISSDAASIVARASVVARLVSWVTSPITTAPRATVLIRLMAGTVFLWEGILKFVYANQGVGRFTKLGFPFPDTIATAIGVFEIVGGAMLISGLFTRFISIAFAFEMIVAMLTTKISLYLGTSPLPAPAAAPKVGIWAVLHETRSDWAQLVCCIFLIVVGAGALSLDARRSKGRRARIPPARQIQAVLIGTIGER